MTIKLQQKYENRHKNHAASRFLDDIQSALIEPISCVPAKSAALELVRIGGPDRKPERSEPSAWFFSSLASVEVAMAAMCTIRPRVSWD